MTARHLTPGEQRTRAAAAAAIARATARATRRPAQDDDADLAAAYPGITPARARQIRLEIQESRNARR